jgi:hypothetical protein
MWFTLLLVFVFAQSPACNQLSRDDIQWLCPELGSISPALDYWKPVVVMPGAETSFFPGIAFLLNGASIYSTVQVSEEGLYLLFYFRLIFRCVR